MKKNKDKLTVKVSLSLLSYRHEKDGFEFSVDGFEPSDYKYGYKTPMRKELDNLNRQAL